MKRQGLALGQGKGYKNILGIDGYIHSVSRLGIKTKSLLTMPVFKKRLFKGFKTLKAEGDVELPSIDLPSVEIDVPEVSADVSLPEMPELPADLEMPDFPSADADVTYTNTMPQLEDAGLQIETPTNDVSVNPDQSLSFGTEMDISGSAPVQDTVVPQSMKQTQPAQTPPSSVYHTPPRASAYKEQAKVTKRELKDMPDYELLDYANREGQPLFFKYNKYQEELLRRNKNNIYFQDDFLKESKRVQEDLTKNVNLSGFMNPLYTLGAKRQKRRY